MRVGEAVIQSIGAVRWIGRNPDYQVSLSVFLARLLGWKRRLADQNREVRRAPVRIEITGTCNAKCSYCHAGPHPFQKGKFIEPRFFERIVDHMIALDIDMSDGLFLYDRGEPFLHKEIGELLDILRHRGLKAKVSTNASRVPDLTPAQWSTISKIKFSISGISPETYKRIYGLDIAKIKRNIEEIARRAAKAGTKLSINWLQYRFNSAEEMAAKEWATSIGVSFKPKPAYIIQIEKLLELAEGKANEELIKAYREELLFFEYAGKRSNAQSQKDTINSGMACQQWKSVNVTEDGELLLCCGLAPWNSENRLGKFLAMTTKDLDATKNQERAICTKCIEHGFAQFDKCVAPWERA